MMKSLHQRFLLILLVFIIILLSYFSWNVENFLNIRYNYWANHKAAAVSLAGQNFTIDESDMLNLPSEDPNYGTRLVLKGLSDVVQAKIARLQKKRCDEGPVLFCGKGQGCGSGFGCDFHHRAACLMLSYAWRIPFVHDLSSYPFSSWGAIFEHLGSNCTETTSSSNQCTFVWAGGRRMVCNNPNSTAYFSSNFGNSRNEDIPYPLKEGIPIESKLLEELKKHHEDPFLWMVGQFYGYAFKFSEGFRRKMEMWRQELRLDKKKYLGRTVGFQIRRGDKIREDPGSRHQLGAYMEVAETYFRENPDGFPRRVFIASDDPEVLTEAKAKYTLPTWNITGYRSTLSANLRTRHEGTEEIVRDIAILVEDCDHVVCGLSSNVCRLILELRTFLGFRKNSLTSLDGSYNLVLDGGHSVPAYLMAI